MLENKNSIRRNLFEEIRDRENLTEEEKEYLKYLLSLKENSLEIFMDRLYPEKISCAKTRFPLLEYFRNPETGEITLNLYDAFQDSDDFNAGLSSIDIKNSEFQVAVLNYFNYLFKKSIDGDDNDFELAKSGYFHENAVGIGRLYVLKKAKNITINRIVERIE